MNIDKLFKLVTNYAKRRENLSRMPETQKHTVKPDYDLSKKALEEEINSIIDERISRIDCLKWPESIGDAKDFNQDRTIIQIGGKGGQIGGEGGSAETKDPENSDDTKKSENDNTSAADDKTPLSELF